MNFDEIKLKSIRDPKIKVTSRKNNSQWFKKEKSLRKIEISEKKKCYVIDCFGYYIEWTIDWN